MPEKYIRLHDAKRPLPRLRRGHHWYVVYDSKGEERGMVPAANLNAAETLAQALLPNERTSCSYTEV